MREWCWLERPRRSFERRLGPGHRVRSRSFVPLLPLGNKHTSGYGESSTICPKSRASPFWSCVVVTSLMASKAESGKLGSKACSSLNLFNLRFASTSEMLRSASASILLDLPPSSAAILDTVAGAVPRSVNSLVGPDLSVNSGAASGSSESLVFVFLNKTRFRRFFGLLAMMMASKCARPRRWGEGKMGTPIESGEPWGFNGTHRSKLPWHPWRTTRGLSVSQRCMLPHTDLQPQVMLALIHAYEVKRRNT